MWISVSSRRGGTEVGVQPKEGCAFQGSGCLISRRDLKAWGTSAVLPEQPAFLSSCHALVARGKMGVSPSVTDSMSFNSKFRRIQRVGVYTVGYKYIKCSVLKKTCACASVWTWRWPASFCHFYDGQTFFRAIIRLMFFRLEKKHFCEHRIGVGFVPQARLKVRFVQLRSNWCRYMKLSLWKDRGRLLNLAELEAGVC